MSKAPSVAGRVVADRAQCVGTAICHQITPFFELDDTGTVSMANDGVYTEAERSKVEEAVGRCPTVALAIQRAARDGG